MGKEMTENVSGTSRFEVHLTRRSFRDEEVKVTSYYEVRIPCEWDSPRFRQTAAQKAEEAKTLANALLHAVLPPPISRAQRSLHLEPKESPEWNLRMAQIGAVDEFTLGVQATFLDPQGEVVAMLAMSFPEDDPD
jgi:hypothetical protein